MPQDTDYYAVLGLPKGTSDAAEIKQAYRRMALRWHPDKNPTIQAKAERRFKQIREAYDVLSDPVQRAGLAMRAAFRQWSDSQHRTPPPREAGHRERRSQRPNGFNAYFGPGNPFTRSFDNRGTFLNIGSWLLCIGVALLAVLLALAIISGRLTHMFPQTKPQPKPPPKPDPVSACLARGVARLTDPRTGNFPADSNPGPLLQSCLKSQLKEGQAPCPLLLVHPDTGSGRAAVDRVISEVSTLLVECAQVAKHPVIADGCSELRLDSSGGKPEGPDADTVNCYLVRQLQQHPPSITKALRKMINDVSSKPLVLMLTLNLPDGYALTQGAAFYRWKTSWSGMFQGNEMFQALSDLLDDSVLLVGSR